MKRVFLMLEMARAWKTYGHGSSPTSIMSPSSSVNTISHLFRDCSSPLISNISSNSVIRLSYPFNIVKSTARPTATPCICTFSNDFHVKHKNWDVSKSFKISNTNAKQEYSCPVLPSSELLFIYLGAASGVVALSALNLLCWYLQLVLP